LQKQGASETKIEKTWGKPCSPIQ